MERTRISQILTVLFAVVLCFGPVGLAEPVGTAFTYQGRLIDNNQPADGLYDLQFKLYDSDSDGNKIGGDVNSPETQVNDGYFTAELDFGSVFDSNAVWLDIGVRPGELGDPNLYTSLSPRQLIAPAPYALYAKTTGGGADSDWIISGNDMYSGVSGNVGIGTTSPVAKLDVSGDINVASAYKIDGSTVLSIPGTDNTFTGFGAGTMNTTGHYNTFSGYAAGFWNTGGNSNTFIGQLAGQLNGTGNSNTFLGTRSGFSNTTGSGNIFLGYYAGYNETGSNKLYIANSIADANVLIYGDFSNRTVGIGTTSPARALHVSDVMRLQPRATAPASPAEGDIYMDSITHKLMVYDGSAWQKCW